MQQTRLHTFALQRPLFLLTCFFIAWKAILIFIVLTSPGSGYDTSTSLLVRSNASTITPSTLRPRLLKFVRWDAIYYTQISDRGHVYEQEWAFGLGLSGIVSFFTTVTKNYVDFVPVITNTMVATTITHVSHLLVVLATFSLVKFMMQDCPDTRDMQALLAASLHVISPAGVFLSTPYSEGLFACLNIIATFFYLKGIDSHRKKSHINGDIIFVLSGLVLAAATTIRSNGILGGLPFLYDAVLTAYSLVHDQSSTTRQMRKLCSLVLGGLIIALGFAWPQYIAYSQYCQGRHHGRPWCDAVVPSIYSWVQDHYWDVGIFRYWKVSNLPLFMLAVPALWLMIYSAIDMCFDPTPATKLVARLANNTDGRSFEKECIVRLAMPQVALGVMAITSSHVQIITRLSSAYLLWYIWLAKRIQLFSGVRDGPVQEKASQRVVRWMVIYALVQAGLYAVFLPPA